MYLFSSVPVSVLWLPYVEYSQYLSLSSALPITYRCLLMFHYVYYKLIDAMTLYEIPQWIKYSSMGVKSFENVSEEIRWLVVL